MKPMRLLLIQGDHVAIYENRKQLAIYQGASGLDTDSAEQTRLARIDPPKKPPEEKNEPH
jgi:hypothetical protein